jgi:hypothetical protein
MSAFERKPVSMIERTVVPSISWYRKLKQNKQNIPNKQQQKFYTDKHNIYRQKQQ